VALDPAALRRRNLIPSAAQPYTNPLGLTYDSDDYEQVMKRALADLPVLRYRAMVNRVSADGR